MLKIQGHYNKFIVSESGRGLKVFANNIAEIKACVEHYFGRVIHSNGPDCPLCRKIGEETAKRKKG